MKKVYWVAALLCVASSSAVLAEDFDNDAVVTLAQTGIGDDVLLAKIASLPCSYDVSTAQLIALKNAGVSNTVIAAMVERCVGSSSAQGAVNDSSDPSVMRAAGLYVDLGPSGSHDLRRIRPTMASGGRVTGNGSLLFPFRLRLGIPRESAQTKAPDVTPTFYFYFETDNRDVGDFGTSATAAAQSPAEFSLVRLKKDNGQRELVVGRATGFNTNVGINPKETIQFEVEELRDGIFAVRPLAPMERGEYGFVLRAGSEAYRIYDFAIGS